MARIKPFKSIRPNREVVSRVAALPYDVYNRKEALEVVRKESLSFLKIDRPETSFDDSVDTYDDRVYGKAKELLDSMIADGTFEEDTKDCYYLYELTMDGRSQTGLVACVSIDDYLAGIVKKHENTVASKEVDRIKHVDVCSAQTGPIFLAYRAKRNIDNLVEKVKTGDSLYDFVSDDNIRHRVWKIEDSNSIYIIGKEFEKMDSIYIADGHHRAASAVKAGLKRREENPGYSGEEEFNYFLSVMFPDEQLSIMDYNRVVSDLNGNSESKFLSLVKNAFHIKKSSVSPYKPDEKGKIGMYLNGQWYELKARSAIKSKDEVEGLDVSLLQKHILEPVLGIKDPRTDNRVGFVGGIRGLEELEKRCQEDMKVAFSMYPTSIEELFSVADAGRLMPPKSTWFEPKLRSGIFIHKI